MNIWQTVKNIYHIKQAIFWRLVYGFPDNSLHLYGVTGTNGKTTTSYLLTEMLAEQYGQEKTGMLSTVALRFGKKEQINKTKLTTLPSRLVFKYLARMKQQGVEYVVLEMTSHALHQHRLFGIKLDGAIILNVAREHLDYHGTIEEYAAAKETIINYLKEGAPVVGKSNDARVDAMLERAKDKGVRVIRFSTEEAKNVSTPLLGEVNRENVLAASKLANIAGVSQEAINRAVKNLKHVPGRMEWIDAPQGFRILIDYAVTPDALERLYAYAKASTKGNVYAILGAAGLRDRGKRPDMAKVVAEYSDLLILTREDPWTESEEQIYQDLEKGLVDVGSSKWKRIEDRRDALKEVLQKAKTGDVVVVTGKGAEQGMAIGKHIIPWNDRKVIEELLKTL